MPLGALVFLTFANDESKSTKDNSIKMMNYKFCHCFLDVKEQRNRSNAVDSNFDSDLD